MTFYPKILQYASPKIKDILLHSLRKLPLLSNIHTSPVVFQMSFIADGDTIFDLGFS